MRVRHDPRMAEARSRLHLPAGTAADGDDALAITPELAGWRRCGLRIVALAPGASRTLASGGDELAVVPLSGAGCTVEVDGRRFAVAGRESVFARVTDWVYVPVGSELRLSSAAGCELAIASARADRRLEAVHVEAAAAPVEVRGAGAATRQLTNFLVPGVFDGAERLICCEALTPDGNWSSYPPHKHDASAGCEVANEEIYYFRVGRAGTPRYAPAGFAVHRTYTADGRLDETATVRDGDAFLVPEGYHGPSIAAPGYPLYYLNVMASDAGPRRLAFVDDPAHAWVRASWEGMARDPRCPLTTAAGARGESF
jgi:5-deoxy-glucuronate isomerase